MTQVFISVLFGNSYRFFGFFFLDFILLTIVFLSAKLTLLKGIFFSLCGLLNLLIPPPCLLFYELSTTRCLSEFFLG